VERLSIDCRDFPIAVRTGTHHESTVTWFLCHTSELAPASCVGQYSSIDVTLEGSTICGRYYDDVWGSIIAGPMWVDYMKSAGPKYDTDEFPEFDGPTGDPSKEGNSSSYESDSNIDN